MKLSEWCRREGISYRTGLRHFKAGTLPVPAHRLATGTIVVEVSSFISTRDMVRRLPKEDQMNLAHEILNSGGLK